MNPKRIKHTTNVNSVEIVEVIRIYSRVGTGSNDDVVRTITEYYELDGTLINRADPYGPEADGDRSE